jgi:hypothetical protein
MDEKIQRILLSLIVFLIPLNIYIIGDWIGTGIQWVFIRYQKTYMGTNLISIFDDFYYINNGYINGKSVLSIQLWAVGIIILIISFIYLLIRRDDGWTGKISGILLILSGIFFIAAIFVQYGVTLIDQSGISIPIGIPLIFILGCYFMFYRSKREKNVEDGSE